MRQLPLAAIVLGAFVPNGALAADEFDRGGYVYFSPGIVAIPVGDDDIDDGVDASYQWGFGGGYMFSPAEHFKLAVGGAFEHSPANREGMALGFSSDEDDTDVGFNLGLRAGAQGLVWRGLMLGGEFGGSLAFMHDGDEDDDAFDDDYGVHTLDIRILVGWYF